VKHQFFDLWTRLRKTLKQRNSALRGRLPKPQIQMWDSELVALSQELDAMREQYLQQFQPIFTEIHASLLGIDVRLQYQRGWSKDKSLAEVLEQGFERDLELGYTRQGAHRADLLVYHDKQLVQHVFSRGQQKVLISALKLAQGVLLRQTTKKACVYLIDDLAAELDHEKLACMIAILSDLNAQVFVTGIDLPSIQAIQQIPNTQTFHVEHGSVKKLSNVSRETSRAEL